MQDGNGALKCRFQKYGELQIRAERLQKHADMHGRIVHSAAIQQRGMKTSRDGQSEAPTSDREVEQSRASAKLDTAVFLNDREQFFPSLIFNDKKTNLPHTPKKCVYDLPLQRDH